MSSKPKQYLIPTPYYCKGEYYPAGSLVTLSGDEKPSRTWKEYQGTASATEAPAPAAPESKKRPSDKEL